MNYTVLTDEKGGTALLTDETCASRHGIPVLVVDAEDVEGDFGPADLMGDLDHPATLIYAAELVCSWGMAPERTEDERHAARRYLMRWAEGPQIPE